MTQYLLSVFPDWDQEASPDDEIQQIYADVGQLNDKMQASGVWVFAGGLHAPETATVVRAHDGEILTTDGPFVETKEQVGGFWVIEASDLDEVLDWAAQATVACRLPVEVRPFEDEPEA